MIDRQTEGLVIGKFYPPHLGHVALIERAALEADRVTAIVMASASESIPLADRVAWLVAAVAHLPGVRVIGTRDDAPVKYDSEIAWIAQTAQMQVVLRQLGVTRLDAVVSSEPYGVELAARLGARAVMHDQNRVGVSISGTAVRADPVGTWSMLPEATRLGWAVRIVLVGGESTGTTTLTEDLQAHYRATGYPGVLPVPEYGREFTYELHRRSVAEAERTGMPIPGSDQLVWLPEYFSEIAFEQTKREDAAALAAPLVIADTDALATTLWERRYVGAGSIASATAFEALPRRDLYIVTDHVEVPFEQDGWRDGEHIREQMTDWFLDAVQAGGWSWMLLRGSREQRLAYAIEAIDTILATRLRFPTLQSAADQ
ncbi:MAG TPA: AAA family ATPase [Galbitalea sp.]